MKDALSLFLLTCPLLFSSNLTAQPKTFHVDTYTSEVIYDVAATHHHVHGYFHLREGLITFDPTAAKISGLVVVKAGSANSGEDIRDDKMKQDILDVPHFPLVTFAASSYKGALAPTGDSTIQVTGTFTLHGTPHELTVPMQVHMEGSKCTAKAHFAVPYVQWGLKNPSNFIIKVSPEVNIDLTLIGVVLNVL